MTKNKKIKILVFGVFILLFSAGLFFYSHNEVSAASGRCDERTRYTCRVGDVLYAQEWNGGYWWKCDKTGRIGSVSNWCSKPIGNPVDGSCDFSTAYSCNAGDSIYQQIYYGNVSTGEYYWKCQGTTGGRTTDWCTKLVPVDGVCDTSGTKYSCTTGTVLYAQEFNGAYWWKCGGIGGGSTTSWCPTVPLPVYGVCNNSVSGDPHSNQSSACTTGTYNSLPFDSDTQYLWTCKGAYGGSDNSNCQKSKPVVYGVCNNSVFGDPHVNQASACITGTYNSLPYDSTDKYLWTCKGSGSGTDNSNCQKFKPINGVCDSVKYSCSSGTPSNQKEQSGAYWWKCDGVYGGTSTSWCPTVPLPVYGVCNNSVSGDPHSNQSSACTTGTYNSLPFDSDTQYLWTCKGAYGGSDNSNCQKSKDFTARVSLSNTNRASTDYSIPAGKNVTLTETPVAVGVVSEPDSFFSGFIKQAVASVMSKFNGWSSANVGCNNSNQTCSFSMPAAGATVYVAFDLPINNPPNVGLSCEPDSSCVGESGAPKGTAEGLEIIYLASDSDGNLASCKLWIDNKLTSILSASECISSGRYLTTALSVGTHKAHVEAYDSLGLKDATATWFSIVSPPPPDICAGTCPRPDPDPDPGPDPDPDPTANPPVTTIACDPASCIGVKDEGLLDIVYSASDPDNNLSSCELFIDTASKGLITESQCLDPTNSYPVSTLSVGTHSAYMIAKDAGGLEITSSTISFEITAPVVGDDGNCSDGIKNGDETGVDTGGRCSSGGSGGNSPVVAIDCDPTFCTGVSGAPSGSANSLDIVYSATDSDNDLDSCELFIDGSSVGSIIDSQCLDPANKYLVTTLSIGTHNAYMTAIDLSGLTTTSSTISFEITAAVGGGGAVCGNGSTESGETCDDGNTVSGDGCSATCQSEGAASGKPIFKEVIPR